MPARMPERLYDAGTETEEHSGITHRATKEHAGLNIPIILAGYTGSGKDTVSHAATELAARTESEHSFQHSTSRYTDRPRRPGEIQGDHGHFVSQQQFSTLKGRGEFFYDYQKMAYGGVRYGFSWPILRNELAGRHTFIVGGEIDTAIGLKNALDQLREEDGGPGSEEDCIKSGIRMRTEQAVHPIILFVNRPKDQIIKGIMNRDASPEEKKKRVAHVAERWEKYPKALDKANGSVEVVWNVELDAAAQQIIRAVQSKVDRQMKNLYGALATAAVLM